MHGKLRVLVIDIWLARLTATTLDSLLATAAHIQVRNPKAEAVGGSPTNLPTVGLTKLGLEG